MKKKAEKQHKPNPFLDARREWDERYGSLISSRNAWRMVAFLSLAIAVVAVGGALLLASQKEVIPYIVEVDPHGTVIKTQPAEKANEEIEQRIITSELASFVKNFRNVVLDAKQQRDNVFKVYDHFTTNSPAFNKANIYFQKNDPFKRAQTETVFCEIASILRLQGDAYEIEWVEKVMARNSGRIISSDRYKLIAYVECSPPTDPQAVIRNPLGLTISDLNWSKEIE